MVRRIEIAIVGAGPYGLSAAAYLRKSGHEVSRVRRAAAVLERTDTGRHGAAFAVSRQQHRRPELELALPDYERDTQQTLSIPIPVDRFVDYGRWFQARAVPDLDQRQVRSVEFTSDGFRIEVDDDAFEAERVVIAAGVGTFAYTPSEYASLGPDAVSHALHNHDLERFRGARVSVIGGGQSALESAALLHEVGADVDVLVRADWAALVGAGLVAAPDVSGERRAVFAA